MHKRVLPVVERVAETTTKMAEVVANEAVGIGSDASDVEVSKRGDGREHSACPLDLEAIRGEEVISI